jgi:hypothetical protein
MNWGEHLDVKSEQKNWKIERRISLERVFVDEQVVYNAGI